MTDRITIGFHDLDETATDADSLYFLFSLAVFCKPKLIVEAGTWKGHFGFTMGNLLPETKVYTADPLDFNRGSPDNTIYFQGDFCDMLEQLDLKDIDMAYIDSGPPYSGDWDYDVRWRHYQAVIPRMAPGGLIASHDMNTKWKNSEKIHEVASIYLTAGRGLTIQQVP